MVSYTVFIFHMCIPCGKTFPLVTRSRSSVKVGVIHQGQFFDKYNIFFLKFVEFFTTQSRVLMTWKKRPFKNIVGKGENAGNQSFLLTIFLTYERLIY